jgi:hypothetical protein
VIALYWYFNINFLSRLASLRSLLSLRYASFVLLALTSLCSVIPKGKPVLLIANRANNCRNGLKCRNKGGDGGENTLNHRQYLLRQPALLVGSGGGKIRIGREIHNVKAFILYYNIFIYILNRIPFHSIPLRRTQRISKRDNRQNTQYKTDMIIILHRAVHLQPRLGFFTRLQMKQHPVTLRRENIVEIVHAK